MKAKPRLTAEWPAAFKFTTDWFLDKSSKQHPINKFLELNSAKNCKSYRSFLLCVFSVISFRRRINTRKSLSLRLPRIDLEKWVSLSQNEFKIHYQNHLGLGTHGLHKFISYLIYSKTKHQRREKQGNETRPADIFCIYVADTQNASLKLEMLQIKLGF